MISIILLLDYGDSFSKGNDGNQEKRGTFVRRDDLTRWLTALWLYTSEQTERGCLRVIN